MALAVRFGMFILSMMSIMEPLFSIVLFEDIWIGIIGGAAFAGQAGLEIHVLGMDFKDLSGVSGTWKVGRRKRGLDRITQRW
jgi:hypothetical protein